MSSQSAGRVRSRRSFIAGAGAGVLGAGVLASAPAAFAKGSLGAGDAAILRFLAAAEILESDLWQQYNELCREFTAGQEGITAQPTARTSRGTLREICCLSFAFFSLVRLRGQEWFLSK